MDIFHLLQWQNAKSLIKQGKTDKIVKIHVFQVNDDAIPIERICKKCYEAHFFGPSPRNLISIGIFPEDTHSLI